MPSARTIREPGVPDGVWVDGFRDAELFGQAFKAVFHGSAVQASVCSP